MSEEQPNLPVKRGRTKDRQPRMTAARKQAEMVAEGGITPLDILIAGARRNYEKFKAAMAEGDESNAERLEARAIAYAEKAAPFCHARLASTTVNATVRRSISDLSTEELIALSGDGDGESGTEQAPYSTH